MPANGSSGHYEFEGSRGTLDLVYNVPPTLFFASSLPPSAVFLLRENPHILTFEVHNSVVFLHFHACSAIACGQFNNIFITLQSPYLQSSPTFPLATQIDFMSLRIVYLWLFLFVLDLKTILAPICEIGIP